MNFLKKNLLFIVALFAILSSFIFVEGYINNQTFIQDPNLKIKHLQSTTSIAKPVNISTIISNNDGTNTYKNEKYGFELEYPEKYIFKENEISMDSEDGVPEELLEGYRYEKPVAPLFYLEFYSSSTIKNPEVEIAIYNTNNLNINEWINYINKGVEQYLIYEGRYIRNIEPIFVLGIESVKALSGCCMECVMNIFVPRENKIYDLKHDGSISLSQKCSNGFNERYGCCWKNEDVFNQILASFKFLKSPQ